MIIAPNRRKHFRGGTTYTARSLVVDSLTTHGENFHGARRFEIRESGVVIPYAASDGTADATTTTAGYSASAAFETALSKVGGATSDNWASANILSTDPQRLVLQFNTERSFNDILYNGFHLSGSFTGIGIKDCKIYLTLDSAFPSTVPESAITGGVLIFDGVLPEHAATDTVQDYVIPLI